MISISHKWKFKVPYMQYACVKYDLMTFRLEEFMSPVIAVQNFGILYTLFMAVEVFSVNFRMREHPEHFVD